jgi:acetyl-CoA synthetase
LEDYEKAWREFNWATMDRECDCSNGGVHNIAAEAMDRHARNWRKNKIALYSLTADGDVKKYTFREMSTIQQAGQRVNEAGSDKG